jgi:hypothetical protein
MVAVIQRAMVFTALLADGMFDWFHKSLCLVLRVMLLEASARLPSVKAISSAETASSSSNLEGALGAE